MSVNQASNRTCICGLFQTKKAGAPAAALRCENLTDSRPARLPHRVNLDLKRLAEIWERTVRFQLKTEIPWGRMMLLSQANRCRSQTHAWHPPTKHKITFWSVKTSISITSAQLHHQKDHLVSAQLKQHTFYWESNSSSSSLTLYFKAKPEHYKKYLINNHNKLNSTSQTDIWPHLFEAGEEDKAAVPCGHFMWRDSLWNTMTQRSFKANEKNPCSVCMLLKWQHTTDDVLQACKTI